MRAKEYRFRIAASLLIATMLSPSALPAQQSSAPAPQQSQPSGVTVDPSAGPLTPSEPTTPQQTPLPEAPQPGAAQPNAQPSAGQQPAHPEGPLGAAAAGEIKTAGGGASRPAGNAIAPVKQHRYRSLVIKLGAVAAVGIAAGTVYGLSRATPSVPPHSASSSIKK